MNKKVVDKPHEDLEIRRLFQDMEHCIKEINHTTISEVTGDITKQAFVNVASTTAQLRAKYLAKVIELESTDTIRSADISTLRGTRLMYEEALEGFSALQHALGRGYFTLTED